MQRDSFVLVTKLNLLSFVLAVNLNNQLPYSTNHNSRTHYFKTKDYLPKKKKNESPISTSAKFNLF